MEDPRQRRLLIISADMGAGHDVVAAELAHRLREQGHRVARRDILALLPAGVGPALRGTYRATVRHRPEVYELVYAAFFRPYGETRRPGSAPLAALAERRLLRTLDCWRPQAVVSTFHLAAQVVGRLRSRGALRVPSAVFVTDFAIHRQWSHAGNDLYLCVTDVAAGQAKAATGGRAEAPGPVVPAAFHQPAGQASARWSRLLEQHSPGLPPVLVSLGAWAVGSDPEDTASLLARSGYLPVVLCGRDERLHSRMAQLRGTLALGWVDDLPGLMTAASALVDNAAGQTAVQALATGLPVIGYRPIPGHGVDGVANMAAAGLSAYALDTHELLSALATLTRPGALREERIATGRALFRADAAALVSELASEPAGRLTAALPAELPGGPRSAVRR